MICHIKWSYFRYGTHIIWCSARYSMRALTFTNIYINDMTNIQKYSKSVILADDTDLIVSSKYVDILQTNIQNDLFNLSHMLFSNKLTLNVKKVILYNIRNSKSKNKLELKV